MLMSVFTATEEELVTFWGRRFAKLFSTYFTESKDVRSIGISSFLVLVLQLFLLLSVISRSKCLSRCCFWDVAILVHQLHTFHCRPDGQQRKARSVFRATTKPVWIELWLSFTCGVCWAMSHGGAHPSPCQTTADVLHLDPDGTSSALAGNLYRGGHSPSDAVLTSPLHVV